MLMLLQDHKTNVIHLITYISHFNGMKMACCGQTYAKKQNILDNTFSLDNLINDVCKVCCENYYKSQKRIERHKFKFSNPGHRVVYNYLDMILLDPYFTLSLYKIKFANKLKVWQNKTKRVKFPYD